MASVTSFIRNMPASSLQAYFDHTGIALPTTVDWTAPEPEVDRQAFEPDRARRSLEHQPPHA